MRAPLRFERGEGVWLIAEDGSRYLDFAAGVAVNSLGHAHPHLVEALKAQAEKVWHLSNLYEVPGQESLARRLTAVTFADTVSSSPTRVPRRSNARSRLRVATTMPRAIRRSSTSSPSRAPSTDARSRPSRRAVSRSIIEGFGPKAPGFYQVPFGDIDGAQGCDHRRDGGDPDRADPGRGRHPPGRQGIHAGAARALRRVRPAADPRRGPVRRRPHRQAFRL